MVKLSKELADKKTLTKRERALIYILIIIIIVFIGGNYILKPSYEKWNLLKLEKQELEIQKFDMEQKISEIDILKTDIDKINLNISESTKNISPFLKDEDIDNMITSLCIFHNLKPVNLSIRSNEYKKINLKQLSDEYEDFSQKVAESEESKVEESKTDILEELDINNKENEIIENLNQSDENEIKDFYIRSAYVTMQFEGHMEDMLKFIDDVNDIPYLSVLEYSSIFSEEKSELFNHKAIIKIIMINT